MGVLNHIELYVSDLKESRKFYEYLLPRLGYALFQDWDQGFSYRTTEGDYIVFVQTDRKYMEYGYHRCHVGLNHLAFQVTLKKEVDELAKELKKNHVKMLYEERYPYAGGDQHYAVFFEDPDRIKLEIVSKEK